MPRRERSWGSPTRGSRLKHAVPGRGRALRHNLSLRLSPSFIVDYVKEERRGEGNTRERERERQRREKMKLSEGMAKEHNVVVWSKRYRYGENGNDRVEFAYGLYYYGLSFLAVSGRAILSFSPFFFGRYSFSVLEKGSLVVKGGGGEETKRLVRLALVGA